MLKTVPLVTDLTEILGYN